MQTRKLNTALVMAFAMLSMNVQAEEPAFAAKSLFFGEDGDVKVIATEKPTPAALVQTRTEGNAVVIATAPAKAPQKVKVVAKKSTKALPVGAAYFVRLKNHNGSTEDALATRVFATGDKFQLGLKVNRPSYVYIFNEDPNGRITMLHPRPGRTAAVDAMGTVFLPAQGAFQFEGPAGLEKLLVLMSEDEVFQPDAALQKITPDLVTRAVSPLPAPSAQIQPAVAPLNVIAQGKPLDCSFTVADAGNYASKAIVYAQDTGSCQPSSAPAYASKAIVFADDPQPAAGQQVASYVVKPQALALKEPLLLKIQLAHH